MTDMMIAREAHRGMLHLQRRIDRLEVNDYFNILYGESNWGDSVPPSPPTATIIVDVFGEANKFNVPIAEAVLQNTSSGNFWKLTAVRDVNKWFYDYMFEAS